jgi:anti-sigma factor RsiW
MSAHSLLRQTAQQAVRVAPAPRASWRMAATVAGLLLTGGLIGAQVAGGETGSLAALTLPRGRCRARGSGWRTHRATMAHAVYPPEVRHPVEVNLARGSASEQRA